MDIAVVFGCLMGLVMLEGVTCQPELQSAELTLINQVAMAEMEAVNEIYEHDDTDDKDEVKLAYVNKENPNERRRRKSLCKRKLAGRCVRRKKRCPGRIPSQKSPGKPYCSKFHRCCYLATCRRMTCPAANKECYDNGGTTTGICITTCDKMSCAVNEECHDNSGTITGSCQCKIGYVRNSSDDCVATCRNISCAVNEECYDNSSTTAGTCQCNIGYVRNSSDICVANCSSIEEKSIAIEGQCFVIFEGGFSWSQAKKNCEDKKLVLASSKNVSSLLDVSNLGIYWTSGKLDAKKGSWFWLDGSQIVNIPWQHGYGNKGTPHDCLAMYANGQSFIDFNCNSECGYICTADSSDIFLF